MSREAILSLKAVHAPTDSAGEPNFNELSEELKAILPYTDNLARGLRGNPRQIKRFLNIIAVRRKLAKENGQEVRPDLLVKLGVLEYIWEDFFNLVVETADPATGRSQLVEEVMRGIQDGTAHSDSKLVSEALAQVGLVSYLSLEPHLTGELDLRPYFFLAQTSLNRGRASVIAPVDEEAKGLVSFIAGEDRLRSKAAAKRAASRDAGVAGAVLRLLIRDLPAAREVSIKTHVVTAIEEICRKHPGQFPHAIKAVEGLDPSEEAVALTASSFLDAAEKAGQHIPPELSEKFRKSSKLVEALAVPKRPTRRIGGGGP